MAGTIIADYIRTDANQLSLNVGNLTFATINSSGFFSNTGTQLIAANGKISGASVIASSIPTAAIADASITNAKLSLSANDSNIKTALNASGSAGIYACRAFVQFDGTGVVAMRASGNVSSITDNGVGDYTVNFTSAMPDANYVIAGAAMYPSAINSHIISYGDSNGAGGTYPTTTAFRFRTLFTVTQVTAQDCTIVTIMVIR
jgi:hypothetical protein